MNINPKNENSLEESEITYVNINCNDLDEGQSYSFTMKNEGGKILLDADFFTKETGKNHIKLTDEQATFEDMEELKRIVSKYNFHSVSSTRKTAKSVFSISDDATYNFTVKWADSKEEKGDYAVAIWDELVIFFKNLSLSL